MKKRLLCKLLFYIGYIKTIGEFRSKWNWIVIFGNFEKWFVALFHFERRIIGGRVYGDIFRNELYPA